VGFLVDPFTETVTDVHDRLEAPDGQAFLDHVRREMQARQLDLVAIAGGQLAMFIDNFGLLRGPEQRYWRFKDGEAKVAGRALILAVDPDTGFLAPIRADSIERIREGIVWQPGVTLLRVEEIILTSPGEPPRLFRRPRFSDERADDGAVITPAPPPPAAADEIFRWVVSARADRTVKEERYVLGADGDAPVLTEMVSAPDLEELHKLLPGNLVRHDPADDDPPEILEYLAPPPAPVPTPFDHDDDEEAAA
jgi:hypothetical protein